MIRVLLLFAARRARGRMALSAAGIALGVALGYGVHLVNRAAVSDVTAAVRAIAGEADLEVRGGRSGFPEALYPNIARLPGVSVASPALELDAGIPGTEGILRLIGIDILRAAMLQPQLVLEDRYELLAPDRIVLSPVAAQALGVAKGDTVSLLPMGGDALGVTTAGLRWQLADATLRAGRSRGLSNEIVEAPASVSIDRGALLVVETAREERIP